MSLIEKYIKGIRFLLPSPFSIALLLTFFTIFLALIWPSYSLSENQNWLDKFVNILNSWNNGLWNVKGLAFAIQMMLMLLLGHVLALTSLLMQQSINLFHFVVIMPEVRLSSHFSL